MLCVFSLSSPLIELMLRENSRVSRLACSALLSGGASCSSSSGRRLPRVLHPRRLVHGDSLSRARSLSCGVLFSALASLCPTPPAPYCGGGACSLPSNSRAPFLQRVCWLHALEKHYGRTR